jgi:transposase-like protein
MLPAPRSPDGRTIRENRPIPADCGGTASIMPVTNAIERLHEEFKRRIKTQCLLPCAETAAMLFWALLASGQITMRRVDGWQTLERSPTDLDLAA